MLPYELPPIFSNRYFYDFLLEYKITLKGNRIEWKKDSDDLKIILKLMFNLHDCQLNQYEDASKGELVSINLGDDPPKLKTIPFEYKILRSSSEFRTLSIIHPKNQLALIEFYDKFKYLILYYCNVSPFSIRYPHKIAKFTYYKDKTHSKNYAHDHEHKRVEEFDKEYKSLKTYFVYKKISNIFQFYESYKYHRCEKKYDNLYKFDVAKCFDSIYSHSISWALLGKNQAKHNICKSNKTFGGLFDKFMRDLNYGETNGIVIGPEFSRIFAELILQRVDKEVMRTLKNQSTSWIYRRDYEIFRYVDDVFVFYNESSCLDDIMTIYRIQLKNYKLNINNEKSESFNKPIITGITRAKLKISDLIKNNLSLKTKKVESQDEKIEKQYSFYVSSNKLITRFKTIIKESDIAYKDIQNYTLACLDRKTHALINIYSRLDDKSVYEKKVRNAIIGIIDFSSFIYSISPKVNSTIKLCMILSKVTKFVKYKKNFRLDNRHHIFKKIYDEIFLVLKKYKSSDYTQVETLYLLIVLKELGSEYCLDEELLCKHYGIDLKKKECKNHLNYFSITVLLFYIEDQEQYKNTKCIIKKHVLKKLENITTENRTKTTELVLILFDLLACPYLGEPFKHDLLNLFGVSCCEDQRKEIISKRKFWFTKWTDFDFVKELEAKKSREVY